MLSINDLWRTATFVVRAITQNRRGNHVNEKLVQITCSLSQVSVKQLDQMLSLSCFPCLAA
jgi:hypothetical protein